MTIFKRTKENYEKKLHKFSESLSKNRYYNYYLEIYFLEDIPLVNTTEKVSSRKNPPGKNQLRFKK